MLTEHGDAFGGGHAEGGEDVEHAVDAGSGGGEVGVGLGDAGEVGVLATEGDADVGAAVEGDCVTTRKGDDVGAGDCVRAHLLHVGFDGVDDVEALDAEVGVRGHLISVSLDHDGSIAGSLHN